MSKKQKKEQFQKSLGYQVGGQIPLVLLTEVDQHILTILEEIVDGMSSIGIQLAVIKPDTDSVRSACEDWAERNPEAVHLIETKDLEDGVFDMEITDTVDSNKLHHLKEHQVIPIAEGGLVEPFDPIAEQGNGFLYEKGNAWSLFAALVRATETYRFPYDWKTLQKCLAKAA